MSIYEDTFIIEITKILQTGIFQQLVVQFFFYQLMIISLYLFYFCLAKFRHATSQFPQF